MDRARPSGRLRIAIRLIVAAGVLTGLLRPAVAGLSQFPIPTPFGGVTGIAAGPDGNLWFTETGGLDVGRVGQIGRITPSGVVTEFQVPTLHSGPWGIMAGPDGNLWFTECATNRIGRITPTGVITEFVMPTPVGGGCQPREITAGPDGNVWFTVRGRGPRRAAGHERRQRSRPHHRPRSRRASAGPSLRRGHEGAPLDLPRL